ncbi:hypothetical protein ACFQ0M_36820 [Kitasatospora aburaviensis]
MVATASGKLRSEQHQQPQRAKRTDGSWATLDDTLVQRPDGTVAPAVASGDLAISGGGTGPLATMTTQDGKQLAVSSPFPGPLPAPVLTGNGALFRDVAPDTDLQVNASKWGGYTTVVVLRTPAAAANPAVRTLVFPTTTKGLELGKNAEGALTASAGGEAVFTAPTPQMWSAKEARTPAARAAAKSAAAESFAGSAPRAQGAPKAAAEAPAAGQPGAGAATRTAPDSPAPPPAPARSPPSRTSRSRRPRSTTRAARPRARSPSPRAPTCWTAPAPRTRSTSTRPGAGTPAASSTTPG